MAKALQPISNRAWDAETKAAHADYLEWSTPPQVEGPVQMGEIMAERWPVARPDASAEWIPVMRRLFLRAPTVLCVVSRAAPHEKIPEWEQILSAGAVCQNILIAATALGLGCQWVTEWCAYDPEIRKAMAGVSG